MEAAKGMPYHLTWNGLLSYELGRWWLSSLRSCLPRQLSVIESIHLSKMQNGRHKKVVANKYTKKLSTPSTEAEFMNKEFH
jgi:hypothetical protein